ncbi:MAG: efflux RND transporter periplasmic adaptor subunit, partial [Alkalispirochaeta sp.]
RVSGRIAEISVRREQEVQPGQRAVVILGTDGFVVETVVSDKDAFRVTEGQQVTARTTTGEAVTARLASRSLEPDYETGLYELTFEVPPTTAMRLGEYLVIELPVDRVRGVFVPREAVVRRLGADVVWTVSDNNELTAQPVTLGAVFDDLVHVSEGLTEGVRYIAAPTGRERDGQSVADER